MINEDALKIYLRGRFSNAADIRISRLGSGVQGSGFLVELTTAAGTMSYVVKTLLSDGLGHDFASDRAGVFLLDLDEYDNLPRHVRAIDVLAELPDSTVKSIGGGREYYLLMERASGTDYFTDIVGMSDKKTLDGTDRKRISLLAAYLADIHSVKKESKALYWRKVRDTVGHGECLMGVFDTYPDGTLSYQDMAEIEKGCVDWRARLKPRWQRLCQIHGDFHPGNIWFNGETDFVLLDRSRGPWGDAADDVSALTINYIFFALRTGETVRDAYLEALILFFSEYLSKTGDHELTGVIAPFFVFRAAVVANPVFYPDLPATTRKKLFGFARNLLAAERFDPSCVNAYIEG